MSRRGLELLGVAAVAGVVVLLLQLAPAPVSAQAQSPTGAAANSGPVAKTPWGEPDFQGIWTRDGEVPLQRPAGFADREFFTEEERARLDKQRADIIGREATEARRNKRGTEQDVGGAYNQAIFLSHLRLGRRTSLIVDPPNGRMPAFTPEEQKKRAVWREYVLALLQNTAECKNKLPACAGGKYGPPSPRRNETPPVYVTSGAGGPGGGGVMSRSDGPEDRGNGERCLSSSLPDFGGFRRIVQSRGQVAIFYDVGQGQGWHRMIPITDKPHAPASIRQWFGDSRGRWEGNTLVVDVTNFSPKQNFNGANQNLHLVERWTRLDPETLEYAVTIEDPTVWVRPWTVRQDLKKQEDGPNRIFYEPRCHEGNYGMPSLLSGARADERNFAQRKGPHPASTCLGGCGGFGGGFADEGEDANPVR